MALTFTAIVPGDGAQLSKNGTMAFTLSTDVRDAEGVMVSVYVVSTDTEEMAWDGAQFVGRYATLSFKTGDDFIVRRRGGWPTGGVSLRVRELGSTEVMTIWTDGSGAPSDAVGVDGDYYLRTSNGAVYKKAAGTYGSPIFTPVSPTTAAPTTGIGAGNTEGVASTYAKSDHDHKLRTGSTDLTIGTLTDGALVARSGTTLATVTTTAAGLALLDDADASAQRTTLGLGSLATASSVAISDLGEMWTIVTANNTIGTPPVALFPSGQDTITLASDTTYMVDMVVRLNVGTSATSTSVAIVGSDSTAVCEIDGYGVVMYTATDISAGGVISPSDNQRFTTGPNTTSVAAAHRVAHFRGRLKCTTGGTLIPQLSGPSGSCSIGKGSYLCLRPIGNGSVTQIGGWA